MEKHFTKMATIAKTFERCEAERIGISKNLIRGLAKAGKIPCVLVGESTLLINYDGLIDYLNTGTQQIQTQQNATDKSRLRSVMSL